MLNQKQQSSCWWGVLGHPGLCRWALGGCGWILLSWKLLPCDWLAVVCFNLIYGQRSGLRHSYRTDIIFISYLDVSQRPWNLFGNLEHAQGPMKPDLLTVEEPLRTTGWILQTSEGPSCSGILETAFNYVDLFKPLQELQGHPQGSWSWLKDHCR